MTDKKQCQSDSKAQENNESKVKTYPNTQSTAAHQVVRNKKSR